MSKPKVKRSKRIDHKMDDYLIPIMIKELMTFLIPMKNFKVKEDMADEMILKSLFVSLK
jgi:hypothetical protein